jgi:GNAT superfamily N-acetyltransferase
MTAATSSVDLKAISVKPLSGKSCLNRFDCGNADINSFAVNKAHKWAEQGRSRVFAGHLGDAPMGLGFYSLSFSTEEGNKLGSRGAQLYKDDRVSIVYLNYLAVRQTYQGEGLGTFMLMDALTRAFRVSKDVAFYGVGLRSLNDKTTAFYERFGFGKIEPHEPMMLLPIWTLKDLIDPK